MTNKITTLFAFQEKGLKSIQRDVKSTDTGLTKVKKSAKGAFAEFMNSPAAIAGAGLAIGAFAQKAIGDASDLEESINAVNVTFGNAADEVLAIGENSAKSFGLSKAEFNGLAVQFSSFADTVSGPGGDVASTLDDMTTRAADFASVMNLEVADAARIFQSGLAGETEPLKKFGINLSAAAVEAYALEKGLAASKSEMTETIKVQARYGLLMQETAKTQGDFANTSDSLANQQRILQASVTDLSAEIGATLIPEMSKLAGQALTLIDTFHAVKGAIEEVGDAVPVLGGSFGFLADHIKRSANPVGFLIDSYNDLTSSTDAMSDGVLTAAESHGKYERAARGSASGGSLIAEANDEARVATDAHAAALASLDSELAMIRGQEEALAGVTVEMAEEFDYAANAQEKLEEQTDRNAAAMDEWLGFVEKVDEAHRELVEGVLSGLSTMFDAEEAALKMEGAYSDYLQAIEDAKEEQKDAEASDRDKADSARDLRIEELNLAGQAFRTAEAFAEEQGAVEGSAEWADIMREALEEQAAQYPLLREEIDLLIAKLAELPESKTIDLQIITHYKELGMQEEPFQPGSPRDFDSNADRRPQFDIPITNGLIPSLAGSITTSNGLQSTALSGPMAGGLVMQPGAIQITSFGSPTPELERMVGKSIDDWYRRNGRPI